MSSFSYLSAASGTADVQLRTGPTPIHGWSARETAGAAASFLLRDGTSPSAPAVIMVTLAPYESSTYEFSNEDGMQFTTGLYLDRVTGTTDVSVWV